MLFRKLKLTVTFAVSYTKTVSFDNCFVRIEHELDSEQTHQLIMNRKVPNDVKETILSDALTQLNQIGIYAPHIIKMHVIEKEEIPYDTNR